MKGLTGKVALVTGAGGAIGRGIALRLAEAGCIIAALDLRHEAAAGTAGEVEAAGGRARAEPCDVADHDEVERAVAASEQALGPTDILVNCAGWDRVRRFLDTDPALWRRIIAINYEGTLNMCHVVVRGMVERGAGRVVTIASDAGRVGSGGEAVYSGCKGALIAFSKALAREVAGKQINVNVVCPGPVDTPLLESFLEEGEYGRRIHEGLARAIPFRRVGRPDDIAGAVAFLASAEAAYITGQVLSVSGGLTMHG